jgi:hypothetical protein
MSDPNIHSHQNMPAVVAGGGAGHLAGGRHIQYPQDTPLTNLYLTLLEDVDVPMETLSDSTGRLELIDRRLTAHGDSLAAFDERCIPAGGVAPRSNTPGILVRRVLPDGAPRPSRCDARLSPRAADVRR